MKKLLTFLTAIAIAVIAFATPAAAAPAKSITNPNFNCWPGLQDTCFQSYRGFLKPAGITQITIYDINANADFGEYQNNWKWRVHANGATCNWTPSISPDHIICTGLPSAETHVGLYVSVDCNWYVNVYGLGNQLKFNIYNYQSPWQFIFQSGGYSIVNLGACSN